MKKSIYTTILLLCIFIFTGNFTIVNADDDLTIPQWNTQAQVLENGDLNVTDNITFRFNDYYNGVFREIVVEDNSSIENISVNEIKDTQKEEYKLVEEAENGDEGVYTIDKESSDSIQIKIFSPSEDQEKTFQISYSVENIAVRYNDTGELYYKFIGSENTTEIDNFSVNVQLPGKINEKCHIFGHGPLNGEVGILNENTYFMRVKDVPLETFVESRILFPREYISLSSNIQNSNGYSRIIEEESQLQTEILQKQQRREAIGNILSQITIVLSVICTGIFILCLIIFRRKINYIDKDELTIIPEDCTPAVAAVITSTPIDSKTTISTMLDLYRKGYISIDKYEDGSDDKFVIKKNNKELRDLLSHEKHFIHWFIDDMGDGSSVSSEAIEKFSKENGSDFYNYFTQWHKKINEDAVIKGYYDKSKGKIAAVLIILSILSLISGIGALIFEESIGFVSIPVSITLFAYGISLIYRRSDYGYEQYKRWMGFKKYMKEYRDNYTIEDINKNSKDISLIYALALGMEMKINDKYKFNREDYSQATNSGYSFLFWYVVLQSSDHNVFENSISNSMGGTDSNGNITGGFSAGGGGGAGGGGAGGF